MNWAKLQTSMSNADRSTKDAARRVLTVIRTAAPRKEPSWRTEGDAIVLEFQSPSSAIINAPMPATARLTSWIVTSLVFAMIVLMAIIKVDQVVVSRGIVVSEAPTILVQPLETAIVRSIEVQEGQRVTKGQVLARLDSTFAKADLGTLTKQINELDAEVARLQSEATGTPYDGTRFKDVGALQASIFLHRAGEFKARLESYDQKLAELASNRDRSNLDAAAYRSRLDLAKDVEKIHKQLEAKKVGTKISSLEAQDARTELARSLTNAVKTAQSSSSEIASVVAERSGYIQTWYGEVAQKLIETQRQLYDLREQAKKAQLRSDFVELRSDRDAVVQSLAKVSVGSILQAAQPLITLVPTDAPLEIEANIPGRENGFVQVGNTVAIKFDTLPFAQYGMATGRVRIVSPDSFTAQTEARNPTGAMPMQFDNEPFYRARIVIENMTLRDLPAGFRIIPGMPVTADVKVGQRTVLSYLTDRIIPVAREGMREP
jgi:HlyD family secretion protein